MENNTLFIVLAVIFGLVIVGLAIYMIVSRNRAPRIENADGGANQFGSCRTGYDVVFRVTSMPQIPAEATLVPRRNLCWIAPVLVALFLLMLFFVYLAARPSGATTTPADQNQSAVTPAPVNPPAQTLDPKTIVDPVNSKIDESTKTIVDKIDAVDKNLTEHRKNAGASFSKASKQREEILVEVKGNGKKLDEVKAKLEMIDANITAGRGELQVKISEMKILLASSTTPEKIESLTKEINKLREKIESLEQQKQKIGDQD